jgi:hypothetical protein
MPGQYTGIKNSFLKKGMSEDDAQMHAAKIFVANGKGGDRHSRAKALAADRGKPKGKKRPVRFGKPFGKDNSAKY